MSSDLDPTAYDVDELRRAARGLGPDPEQGTETEGMHSAPGRAAAAEELLLAAADGRAERPYLPALPAGFGAETQAEEFCSFLLERAGFAAAYRALVHYEETGWLGRSAREALETRLTGLADGTDPRPAGGRLTAADHRVSLVYVARLATVGGHDDGTGRTPDIRSDGGVDERRHVGAETLAEWFGDGAASAASADPAAPGPADDTPSDQSGQ